MNKRFARAFSAMVVAGATAATLGMASAGAAPVPTDLSAPVYTSSQAGFGAVGGGHFRYVEATVKVPAINKSLGTQGVAAVILAGPKYEAQMVVLPGAVGTHTVLYAERWFKAPIAFTMTVKVGDQLKLSIFRDKATGKDKFTVVDLRNGRTRTATVKVPLARAPHLATVSTLIQNSKVKAPHRDTRIWVFKGIKLTTYNGERGNLFDHWATFKIFDTRTGTPTGHVVMFPGETDGSRFGVFLNAK